MIRQVEVAPLFPETGSVRVVLVGEAPGPRGADRSGIPFWGDRAGQPVYRALERAGLAKVPAEAWEDWDGERLIGRGLKPTVRGAMLTNAYPRCPTSDGHTFRAPRDRELRHPDNLHRIRAELAAAARARRAPLTVIAFGQRARFLLERLEEAPAIALHCLPHPSAQGLLQAAPGKGKGLKLAALERQWEAKLERLLRDLR